jgi:hypothetical protein
VSERNGGKNGPDASRTAILAMDQDVGLMSAQLMIFLSDEVERMCDLLNINAQEYCVNALQEEIHTKAVVRACTKFNTDNGMEIY